ncbi:YtfG protein [Companilactobacillus mindensis DSM 14500]|uniref:YtfG protein n=1 Tax=Companilactobacillus mindensis DSM 14500 TaxID=1423770 RepID=A0A0R1QIU4_9LACO|nr:NAD(P)H-binding protein [Companilactobacillus mindensis]KRL44775.1 YtfG protein [Companilactobacillus mindensis DSM 14500]GEO78047.1 NAD(P)-dependent oxidoreductase [Companilactobacillus mindensis]
MNIMVTGANGGYGSLAIDYLQKLAPNANVYGLVRSEAKGAALKEKGIQIRIGDYADFDSMKKALNGIDRLLFVSSPIPGIQKNVVDAAIANDVKYIAYTSIFQPEYSKFGLEINHKQTEEWIKESGIAYTILRNSWYMEVNQALFEYVKKTDKFVYFATEGKLSFALKREYAEAGARVISKGDFGSIINLANTPRSYEEISLAAQKAVGHGLDIETVRSNEFIPKLVSAGISANLTNVSAAYQEYTLKRNNGEERADKTEFEKILGHPLTSLSDAIKELES